jgi:cell division inhibitor SulA
MLLSLVPLPLLQQLMLQSLWLAHALGQESASHGWFTLSPMFSSPGLNQNHTTIIIQNMLYSKSSKQGFSQVVSLWLVYGMVRYG